MYNVIVVDHLHICQDAKSNAVATVPGLQDQTTYKLKKVKLEENKIHLYLDQINEAEDSLLGKLSIVSESSPQVL